MLSNNCAKSGQLHLGGRELLRKGTNSAAFATSNPLQPMSTKPARVPAQYTHHKPTTEAYTVVVGESMIESTAQGLVQQLLNKGFGEVYVTKSSDGSAVTMVGRYENPDSAWKTATALQQVG